MASVRDFLVFAFLRAGQDWASLLMVEEVVAGWLWRLWWWAEVALVTGQTREESSVS